METKLTYELRELPAAARALIEGETDRVANLANLAAIIFHSLPGLNWCGFYLKDPARDELILGPFQGRPACIRIKKGKGVCGTAWQSGKIMNVPDVLAIANHIACDSATRSELVLPIYKDKEFQGVLDLDSPELNHFSPPIEKIMAELIRDVLPAVF